MIEEKIQGSAGPLNGVSLPRSGSNSTAILLHHGVTRRWQTFLPLFPSLNIRRPVWAFDARGHGQSSRAADGDYLVIHYVADLVDWVQQQFDRPVVLYGHSLGAMVVAAAAARLGDHVEAVVMEDPPMSAMGARIGETSLLSLFQAFLRAAKSDAEPRRIAHQLANEMLVDPTTGVVTRLGDVRDTASLRSSAAGLKQLDPGVLEPVVAGRWLEGYDAASIFAGIHCPALLLQADPDAGGMLVDDEAKQLVEWAPDLTRVRMENCSHNMHWDRTTALLNYVHGFLESVSR